jgi:rhodanese-related sulfurtransferase
MRTNIKNIFAAGDCVVVKDLITDLDAIYPFGSLANRQGRVVADAIAGLKTKFKGAVGNASVKVFGFTIASVGLSEYQAKLLDFDYDCVWGCWYDRPDYMPESKVLFGKMIFGKKTLRLLGLQLAGRGEVTRYIDVFSVLASKKANADDMLDFEHAYTPTHSGPMNPLNFLGAMALAQENYKISCVNPLTLENYKGQILDVREKSEIDVAKCNDNAVESSVDEYKEGLNKLNKNKELLVVCQKGPRSYEVAKYAIHIGFQNVKYLGGGMQLAKQMLDKE